MIDYLNTVDTSELYTWRYNNQLRVRGESGNTLDQTSEHVQHLNYFGIFN
ncbi:hypothetical protein QKU58_gp062 [Pyramimonas orientalis virus]|uniref:Uncharacterized protein n=1 Tax=Pyramimonas orientalis virus 01B TaxID=3134525 RepID=A0A7L9AXI2_9VIRU|nr:hypothetical protein QKU58_gp062 [Pyramimonas orientalis virus]QOI90269.1 hypothetical protein HWQ62_00132 [Pyramimonas orientalis virus]